MNNKIINNLVHDVEKFIENESHYGDHINYVACNVKLRSDKFCIGEDDILAICKELNLSKNKTVYITELFNEQKIDDVAQYYLENQAEYLQEEFFNKCCINSQKYYQGLISDIKTEKNTCYPDINNIKNIKDKIKEVQKWAKKDQKESDYIDVLKHMNGLSGFFGLSGGWYAILEANRLENLILELRGEGYCWEDKIYFYNQLKDLYKACQWALKTISSMKEGLDIREEIKCRITEELEQEGFIEDTSAINYAIN